jgi:hypothetical protein
MVAAGNVSSSTPSRHRHEHKCRRSDGDVIRASTDAQTVTRDDDRIIRKLEPVAATERVT